MTEIKETRKGDRVRVSIHGHAGVEPGNDPVCNALSILTYTMIGKLDKLEDAGKIRDLIIDIDDGHAIVSFTDRNKVWAELWDTISLGYRMLSEEYPNNVYLTT